MRNILFATCALSLAACVPPAVTAFNGDSVTVKTTASGRSIYSDGEAQKLCQRSGKAVAEFLSTKPIPGTYDQEHLYACLDVWPFRRGGQILARWDYIL